MICAYRLIELSQDCYVEEDTTMLTTVARSLQRLEGTFVGFAIHN
jgi:hypothetical protein